MSRSTCKIKGLKYPSADKITSRISTLRRSMACTLMHRDACTPEQEVEWSKFFVDNTCAYCGRPATHLDHLHPMIRDNEPTGYGTDPNNLVPCCEKCNRSKGNMEWESYMLSENCDHIAKTNQSILQSRDERIQTIKDFQTVMKAEAKSLDAAMRQQWADQWNALEQELQNAEAMLLNMKSQIYGNGTSTSQTCVLVQKSGNSMKSSSSTDELAGFKSFYRKGSSASYCNAIRKIVKEMGLASISDLDSHVGAAIDYCTSQICDPQKKTEKKKYSDIRSALRKYREYLETISTKADCAN